MINTDQLGDTISLPQELVTFINKFVTKHENEPDEIIVKAVQDKRYGRDINFLKFFDPRFEKADPIGMVSWMVGSRSPMEYMINSRLISNNQHRWSHEERQSYRTKDLNKAVKFAKEFIKHYDVSEFAHDSFDRARREHSRWVDELNQVQYEMRPSTDEILEEVENLKSMGITFKTKGFNRFIEKMDTYKEWQRRRNLKSNTLLECVVFSPIGISWTKPMAGGALDKAIQLKSVEELPEKQRNCLALLHLVDSKRYVPNIGFKESDTVYWVYSENVL